MKQNKILITIFYTLCFFVIIQGKAQNIVTFIPPPAGPKPKIDTILQMVDAGKNLSQITIRENKVTLQTGFLINNVKTGTWTTYYPNGILFTSAEYKEGRKNGIYKEHDKTGLLSVQQSYLNDTLHGEQIIYSIHKNSPLIKSKNQFKKGKLHGTSTTYNSEGLLQSEIEYSEGLKNGTTKWYFTSGKLAMEQVYKNGILHGTQKIYNSEGILVSQGNFSENQKSGIWIEYHDNGKLKAKGSYKNNEKYGAWNHYDEAENLTKTENF